MTDPNTNKHGVKFWLPIEVDIDDNEVLTWEQRRGSMPDDAQLGDEYEECERVKVAA